MPATPTLLLADDSASTRRLVELTFAEHGVRVVSVGDGRRAMELARQDPPHIMLVDIGMPDVDGYEVATFIRSQPALRHIPVLLLAGAFDPPDDARVAACGAAGVLVKPLDPQVVITRVAELLRRAGERPAGSPPPYRPAAGASAAAPAAAARPAPVRRPAAPAVEPSASRGGDEFMDFRSVPPPSAATPAPEMPARQAAPAAPVYAAPPARPVAEPAPDHGPVADAFAAMLAAEPAGAPPAAAAPAARHPRLESVAAEVAHRVAREVAEQITREEVTQIAERIAREITREVAEDLVRAEIARIRAAMRE